MNIYKRFRNYEKKIGDLQVISNYLSWELKINTPEDGKQELMQKINDINIKIFNMKKSKTYINIINELINSNEFNCLDNNIKRYVLRIKKHQDELKRIPNKFYKEYDLEICKANDCWEKAKDQNDYQMFKPYLEKVIKLTKKLYKYKNPQMNVYDAMLNDYSEGVNVKIVDKLFKEIKDELIPLIKKVKVNKVHEYIKNMSIDTQYKCANLLLNYIGFDLNRGALGIYPHGFSEKIASNDIRIAFSKSNNPTSFVSTIIHEGGHGIFEQNVSNNIASLESMTIDFFDLHESVSRFYENILGRNKNFWLPIYDEIKKVLKIDLSLDEFIYKLNEVNPSLIRTDADELTYPLHIIVRYEIEKEIFNNDLDIEKLPDLWNKLMKEYLGVNVTNDKEGLMQDVHWSDGSFGYFPSYLLGNIYDGMILKNIEKNLGNVDELLKNGKILEITKYLSDNIFINGGSYNALELIEKVTNKKINAQDLLDYYKKKYL